MTISAISRAATFVALVLVTVAATLYVTRPSTAHTPEPKVVSLWFEAEALDELVAAGSHAAWCGGGVTIDIDDLEVLVGDCDQ